MSEQKRQGAMLQNHYHEEKQYRVRSQKPEKLHRVQDEISHIEQEALELERMEAELLVKLQQTQKQEVQAFQRFENAMVEAS